MARKSKASGPAGRSGKVARLLLLGTVLLAPLVFSNSLFDPYNLPKLVLTDAGIALSFVALQWHGGRRGIGIVVPARVACLFGAGILWCWLSLFWALNRYGAFVLALHWSLCAAALILFCWLFASERGKVAFLTVVAVAAVLVSLISLLYRAGALDVIAGQPGQHPIFGPWNISAQFLLCCVPAMLWLVFYGRGARTVLAAAVGLGAVVAHLFHVQSEASWIAVVVECLLFGCCVAWFHWRSREPVMPVRLAVAAGALFAASFLVLSSVSPEGFRWQGGEAMRKLAGKWTDVKTNILPAKAGTPVSESTGGSTKWRLVGYQSCLEMARRHPLSGVGLFNFEVHHPAMAVDLGNPTFVTLEANYDTAHDDYLQVLGELGVPGALLACALIAVIMGCSIRLCRIGGTAEVPCRSAAFRLVAMCALAGYMTDALFCYPSFTAVPPLLAVAFVAMLFSGVGGGRTWQLFFGSRQPVFGFSLLLATAIVVFGVMRLVGGYHFAEQRDAVRKGEFAAAQHSGELARRWNPFFPYNDLLTGIQLMATGSFDQSEPCLERFGRQFPDKPPLLYYLATHRLQMGRLGEAARLAERARQIAPDDAEIRRLAETIARLQAQRRRQAR